MVSQQVAVAPDVDDVAAVEQPVQRRGDHDLVAQDSLPTARSPGSQASRLVGRPTLDSEMLFEECAVEGFDVAVRQ